MASVWRHVLTAPHKLFGLAPGVPFQEVQTSPLLLAFFSTQCTKALTKVLYCKGSPSKLGTSLDGNKWNVCCSTCMAVISFCLCSRSADSSLLCGEMLPVWFVRGLFKGFPCSDVLLLSWLLSCAACGHCYGGGCGNSIDCCCQKGGGWMGGGCVRYIECCTCTCCGGGCWNIEVGCCIDCCCMDGWYVWKHICSKIQMAMQFAIQ